MTKNEIEYERSLFANDLAEYKYSEQGNLLRLELEEDKPNLERLKRYIEQYYGTRGTDMMVWVDGNREKGIASDNRMREYYKEQREKGGY